MGSVTQPSTSLDETLQLLEEVNRSLKAAGERIETELIPTLNRLLPRLRWEVSLELPAPNQLLSVTQDLPPDLVSRLAELGVEPRELPETQQREDNKTFVLVQQEPPEPRLGIGLNPWSGRLEGSLCSTDVFIIVKVCSATPPGIYVKTYDVLRGSGSQREQAARLQLEVTLLGEGEEPPPPSQPPGPDEVTLTVRAVNLAGQPVRAQIEYAVQNASGTTVRQGRSSTGFRLTVPKGGRAILKALNDPGKLEFQRWQISQGVGSSETNPITVGPLSADATVTAVYEELIPTGNEVTLTIKSGRTDVSPPEIQGVGGFEIQIQGGEISCNRSTTPIVCRVTQGATVRVTAPGFTPICLNPPLCTQNLSFPFFAWKEGGPSLPPSGPTPITTPLIEMDGDRSWTAWFRPPEGESSSLPPTMTAPMQITSRSLSATASSTLQEALDQAEATLGLLTRALDGLEQALDFELPEAAQDPLRAAMEAAEGARERLNELQTLLQRELQEHGGETIDLDAREQALEQAGQAWDSIAEAVREKERGEALIQEAQRNLPPTLQLFDAQGQPLREGALIAVVGRSFRLNVRGSDENPEDRVRLTVSPLPAGAEFADDEGNPASGELIFTADPSQHGLIFEVTFTATDSQGAQAHHTISLQVVAEVDLFCTASVTAVNPRSAPQVTVRVGVETSLVSPGGRRPIAATVRVRVIGPTGRELRWGPSRIADDGLLRLNVALNVNEDTVGTWRVEATWLEEGVRDTCSFEINEELLGPRASPSPAPPSLSLRWPPGASAQVTDRPRPGGGMPASIPVFVGERVELEVEAWDFDEGDRAVELQAPHLPEGANFEIVRTTEFGLVGRLAWTPTPEQAGTAFEVSFVARDETGLTSRLMVTLDVKGGTEEELAQERGELLDEPPSSPGRFRAERRGFWEWDEEGSQWKSLPRRLQELYLKRFCLETIRRAMHDTDRFAEILGERIREGSETIVGLLLSFVPYAGEGWTIAQLLQNFTRQDREAVERTLLKSGIEKTWFDRPLSLEEKRLEGLQELARKVKNRGWLIRLRGELRQLKGVKFSTKALALLDIAFLVVLDRDVQEINEVIRSYKKLIAQLADACEAWVSAETGFDALQWGEIAPEKALRNAEIRERIQRLGGEIDRLEDHLRSLGLPRVEPGGPYSGDAQCTPSGNSWECQAEITLDGRRSSDPDGQALQYRWDFDDGRSEEGASSLPHTYRFTLEEDPARQAPSAFIPCLMVTDEQGLHDQRCTSVYLIPREP
jgi:hypothetical protein